MKKHPQNISIQTNSSTHGESIEITISIPKDILCDISESLSNIIAKGISRTDFQTSILKEPPRREPDRNEKPSANYTKKKFLNLKETSEFLGVTRTTLWRMHSEYKVIAPPTKVSPGKIGYLRSYIEDWIQAQMDKSLGDRKQ